MVHRYRSTVSSFLDWREFVLNNLTALFDGQHSDGVLQNSAADLEHQQDHVP